MSYGNRPSSSPGGLSGLINQAQLVWRLMNDDRISTAIKVAIPLLVGLYFLSPIDFIPDFIPGLGQLDDLGVVLLGMTMFVNMSPKQVVNEHRVALGLAEAPFEGPQPGQRNVDSNTRRMDPSEVPGNRRQRVVDSTYRESNGGSPR